jgi:hypothetical protein
LAYTLLIAYTPHLTQVYIFGGNNSLDTVEVLDTDLGTIQLLMGPDGLPMRHPSLLNNLYSCAVGLDDSNSILIAGGIKAGT